MRRRCVWARTWCRGSAGNGYPYSAAANLAQDDGLPGSHLQLPEIKLLYVGGEALPDDLADQWAAGRWLENGYGPTECTVTVTRGRIRPGQPVTIGKPVRGHVAHVLDDALDEVPPVSRASCAWLGRDWLAVTIAGTT